ncbi:hypothetical protein [Cohnella hashimotonis]|uniref:SGNH hydrolase-type esterase domain-containing protein n=1 Tax=Cohnella hashimotonis TaxID=2826895 RepID=A0ABT6TIA6_9BACL|nr:hypothetical protein [Cohnella hashimotonis]MDI4646439.1 hypothetical protein [Cohnella hashimotonis]
MEESRFLRRTRQYGRFGAYLADRVSIFNAGVGGTDSSFGAARLREHVGSLGPIDLLFVEFAVNDGEDRAESLAPSIRLSGFYH